MCDLIRKSGLAVSIGYVFWALYLILIVLVFVTLMNLLIRETFAKTFESQRDIEWKFAKTELLVRLYEMPWALVPPYNFIELICRILRIIFFKPCSKKQQTNTIPMNEARKKNGIFTTTDSANKWWSSEAGKWQQWQSWVTEEDSPDKNYMVFHQISKNFLLLYQINL